jgi:hypothetical protein
MENQQQHGQEKGRDNDERFVPQIQTSKGEPDNGEQPASQEQLQGSQEDYTQPDQENANDVSATDTDEDTGGTAL